MTIDEVNHYPIVSKQDDFAIDSGAHRNLGISTEVTPFTVYWHHVLGMHDVVHVGQFASSSVAGHVDQSIALVNHVGAQARQAIDDSTHGVFVARNQRRGQDHRVAFATGDLVIHVGHARERRHRFTL